MLADDVVAAAGSENDRFCRGATTRIAGALQDAQRFKVEPGLWDPICEVCDLPLQQQVRAFGICRAPFETTWFEWKEAGSRWGVLLETDASGQRGTCRLALDTSDDPEPFVLPAFEAFDWSEDPAPVKNSKPPITAEEFAALIAADPDELLPGTVDELNDLNRRHGTSIEPSNIEHWSEWKRNKTAWNRCLHTQLRFATMIVRAVLLLLNSRNNSTVAPHVPSAKLQKARERVGKAPLLDFTTVDISVSRLLEQREAGTNGQGLMRLHMVRRHPRLLQTGRLTWVRAHPRGSALAGLAQQTRVIAP